MPDGTKSTDQVISDPKKKYGPDVVVPKRACSAFIFYSTEQVIKIKEKEKCSHTDAMKKVGEIWANLPEKDKKKYNDMHDKDQKRYDK
jgi:hypothetical protein